MYEICIVKGLGQSCFKKLELQVTTLKNNV